ncbi:MAG: hypothetical protein GOV15_00080 [Candidatus Diapherotrites archaeon]|nr:hypothetical protein [Candidatus Diapherotrites archaeon]
MAYPQQKSALMQNLPNILIMVGLLIVLLFVLTKFNLVDCDEIPLWCPVYYSVAGSPRVLLVHGSDGLGDAALLREGLSKHSAIFAESLPISSVGSENLKDFALVIVTEAKTMNTDVLVAFARYVDDGGRLVWIGDAGTDSARSEDDYWYGDDEDRNATHERVGAWVRKDRDGYKLDFGKDYLSANYISTYCGLENIDCNTDAPSVGDYWFSRDDLVQGIKRDLRLERDFVLIEKLEAVGGTKIVAGVEADSAVKFEGKNYGRDFPLIVKTGVGGRVAYYAIPPESYLDESQGELAPSFIQNMIDEMRP